MFYVQRLRKIGQAFQDTIERKTDGNPQIIINRFWRMGRRQLHNMQYIPIIFQKYEIKER